jgi:hypothetical protein
MLGLSWRAEEAAKMGGSTESCSATVGGSGDGIFWVAKHGVRRTGMFANGVWEADQKLWTVAAYIYRIRNLPPRVADEIDKAAKSGE